MPLAVVAIGGNSLVTSHQVGTIAEQFANAALTCQELAHMVESGWDIVLTHGNGPQVGNVLLRVELAAQQVYTLPLDICDADTEGGIGYMLQQVLGNALRERGIARTVVTVITQVLVDAQDPAFTKPTKPIGPFFDRADAEERMRKRGWQMVEEPGRGWRRVVPSPKPKRILELDAIKRLTGDGIIPIAVGGGGVPVVERGGQLMGVEAVVDKDLASAMLARALGAELLLISTGVDHVQKDFATPSARDLQRVLSAELRRLWQAGAFAPGSMSPKIEAALQFIAGGGKRVIITSPRLISRALAGEAGTIITR